MILLYFFDKQFLYLRATVSAVPTKVIRGCFLFESDSQSGHSFRTFEQTVL